MSGYTKLFSSIIASTIWREPDHVRLVWITMLAMSDRDGIVEGSIPGLAALAGQSIDATERALARLAEPDKYSRSQELNGARIVAVDGGWRVVNKEKYDAKSSRDEVLARNAERQARFKRRRAELKVTPEVTLGNAEVTPVTNGDGPQHYLHQQQHQQLETDRTNAAGDKPRPVDPPLKKSRRPRGEKQLRFTVAALVSAFAETAGTQFTADILDDGIPIAITARIKSLDPGVTLDDVRLAGSYVASGGLGDFELGTGWLATTGKLASAISKARAWDKAGRPTLAHRRNVAAGPATDRERVITWEQAQAEDRADRVARGLPAEPEPMTPEQQERFAELARRGPAGWSEAREEPVRRVDSEIPLEEFEERIRCEVAR